MKSRLRLVQCHSRNLLLVHVVWATKFRVRMLRSSADAWLAESMKEQACEMGCVLVACGNAADHVHVVIRYPSTVCLADVIQRLKGGTSHAWNVSGRSPRLSWQRGYWAESFGPSALWNIVRYVELQRAHHEEAAPLEEWEADSLQDPQAEAWGSG